MLTIIRSPLPTLPRDHTLLPLEAGEGLARVEQEPQRCQWVVPTERRRRVLVREWSTSAAGRAILLPGLHTLESLVAQGLAYSPRPRPRVSDPERLLRIARAWQEVFGRSAGSGLVRQLDHWASDWQAGNLAVPDQPRDVFELFVQRYLRDLDTDGLLDRMRGVAALTGELLDPHSWPNQLFFDRQRAIILDGFHRLEAVERNLIAALSQRCDVWLWLVGTPGRASWRTVEAATRHLQRRAGVVGVSDWVPTADGLPDIGRRLFPVEDARPGTQTRSASEGTRPSLDTQARRASEGTTAALPSLARGVCVDVWRLEAPGTAAEVEAAAKRIKADYLAASATGRPLRLSDIALVIPGPAYEPLIREILPRLGLPFHFAGRAFPVCQSRPARILLAAWQLCRSQWRHDLLLDFLSQPLVKDRLKEAHRLMDLFQHRPRARRLLNYGVWAESWDQYVRALEDKIVRWQNGTLDLPDRGALGPREEFIERQRKLADGLRGLIGSIKTVLAPVAAMDRLMTSPPEGPAPLRRLVRACLDLLHTLRVELWLKPPLPAAEPGRAPAEPAVPWEEYAKDQQAYARLVEVLQAVGRLPEARLPLNPQKRPDGFTALNLALENQTYQLDSVEDAGVQILELDALGGLRFRRVFVLGLLDGQYPPPSEEGALGGRRRQYPALFEQLQQKEEEAGFLFGQVFEAAEEAVVLCRPVLDGAHQTRPSAFLTAVERQGTVLPMEPAAVVASWREAGSRLGRAGAGRGVLGKAVEELWPAAGDQAARLGELLAGLAAFHGRGGWSRQVRVHSPALLRLLFPEDRPFSLSELETYAACPFRYFGNRALRLDERDPDQTRIQYGWLVHRVLQNFYVKLHKDCGNADGQPLPAQAADHRQRLLELFEAEWEQLDDGTLPPDLKHLFGCEGGILALLLETLGFIEADYGNYRNEYVLQADAEKRSVQLGTDPDGRAVYLSGTVDCIGLHRLDPSHAIILDYKTGRAGARKDVAAKMTDGRLLQLPLYAAALRILHPHLRVVGGAYIHLSEREQEARKAVLAAGELLPPAGKAAPLPFDPAAARAKAIELAQDIRAGRFSLTVHDADQHHAECNFFCALRHACRHPKGYQTPYSP